MRKWWNPFTWFSYTNPETGEHYELDISYGSGTKSGVVITEKKALMLPVVWACIRLISGTISTLPLKLFKEENGQKIEEKGGESFILRSPNRYMTMGIFSEAVAISLLLNGNHYSLIERNDRGEAIALTPLDFNYVCPNYEDGDLVYELQNDKGDTRTIITPENMLHFKIFSPDGIVGLSFIEYLKETLGLLTSATEYSAYHMKNGGFSGGYVIFDQFLTSEQRTALKARFEGAKQTGAQDISKVVVIEGGAKFQSRNVSQKDAQFLESRSFDVVDICGALGVPPHMIGRTEKSTSWGSGIEQQNIGFMTYSLRYYLARIEQEINEKIYKNTDYKCEFMMQGLLRGDSASRAAYYTAALGGSAGSGWMAQNEVRKLENLPPVENGDTVTQWNQGNESQDNSTL